MNRNPRVAFVSHSVRLYGASRSLFALLEGFREHGIEACAILPGSGPIEGALEARRFAYAIVPFPCWIAGADENRDLDALRAARAAAVKGVVAVLKRVRADVVWSNSSVTPVGALAAAALGLPHVWHLREANGDEYPFRFVEGTEQAVELIRTAAARIAVSRAIRTAYEELGSGPCDVVYSGIAPATVLARRRISPPLRTPVRMILADRIRREKGQIRAIEATRLLVEAGHRVELRIAGDGDVGPCREAIERTGLRGAVTLAGFVPNLDEEYPMADLALSCSRFEAMGRTTVEAMSFGLPVVGCNRMGTAELIEHEVTGLLCDGSPAEIARAVIRLTGHPEEARALGRRAQRFARRTFSNERCTRASLDVLRRALERAPTPSAQTRAASPVSRGDERSERYSS